MAIANYTDIITLERARTYLRIDDGMNEDDAEIESMIKAAFIWIERYTSHIFVEREFDVYGSEHCKNWVKVYNYPISAFTPSDTIERKSTLYNSFYIEETFSYLAGYDAVSDVPDDFIQSALQIIKVWYYESEKQENSTLIPISVKQVLDTYRRFI